MKKLFTTRSITLSAAIAALYAALTLLLRPVAYAILVGEKRRVPTRHREVKSF